MCPGPGLVTATDPPCLQQSVSWGHQYLLQRPTLVTALSQHQLPGDEKPQAVSLQGSQDPISWEHHSGPLPHQKNVTDLHMVSGTGKAPEPGQKPSAWPGLSSLEKENRQAVHGGLASEHDSRSFQLGHTGFISN